MKEIKSTGKKIKWSIFTICVILFILIMCAVLEYKVLFFDKWVIELMVNIIRRNWLTVFFKVFTFFGEAKLLIPVGGIGALVGFFVFKDKLRASCYITNLITISGLNWTIKHIIQRPRPDISLRLVEEDGYSFPSGHAMITTAFYGLIIYFIWNNIKNKIWRNIICICLIILIIMIDFSRVYLGVHYLSDVLAGSLISVAYLIVAVEFAKRFIFNKNNT